MAPAPRRTERTSEVRMLLRLVVCVCCSWLVVACCFVVRTWSVARARLRLLLVKYGQNECDGKAGACGRKG